MTRDPQEGNCEECVGVESSGENEDSCNWMVRELAVRNGS